MYNLKKLVYWLLSREPGPLIHQWEHYVLLIMVYVQRRIYERFQFIILHFIYLLYSLNTGSGQPTSKHSQVDSQCGSWTSTINLGIVRGANTQFPSPAQESEALEMVASNLSTVSPFRWLRCALTFENQYFDCYVYFANLKTKNFYISKLKEISALRQEVIIKSENIWSTVW